MSFEQTLGVAPLEAIAVVLSAIAIALVLLGILRLLGQRSIARMTTFDVAILLVLGSAGGRVITGYTPTLAEGILAVVTLVLLGSLGDRLARTEWGARLFRDRPILLVDGEEILRQNLRRARVSDEQLWEALRTAGIRNLGEVAAVVFESTGSMSVLRRGETIDPRLLTDVQREIS